MSNFAISQALFNNQSEIITIDHTIKDQTSGPDPPKAGGARLSHGSIAGIAIGSSVGLVLLLSFLFYLFRRSQRRRQASVPDRLSISGPIPSESTKDLWANSPTGSGDQSTGPPMTAISNDSPLQRLEERLQRLERANTTTTELPEDPTPRTELSGEDSHRRRPPIEMPKQELPGSPTAKELLGPSRIGRDRVKPARHVFELAAGDSRRASGKK